MSSTIKPSNNQIQSQQPRNMRLFHMKNAYYRDLLALLDKDIEEKKAYLASQSPGENVTWNTNEQRMLLIITTFRSGSTFLGDIISHHPTVFYHYEPLWQAKYGAKHITDEGDLATSLEHLRRLFYCK